VSWALYAYPLSFDVTADGKHMVYGYSNSGFCCPISFAQGTYVRPVTNSPLEPISISGREDPTLFGDRVRSKKRPAAGRKRVTRAYERRRPWTSTRPPESCRAAACS